LAKDPSQRLGSKEGAKELKRHPWMKDVDFVKIAN